MSRERHAGLVYDFTIPGDATFCAGGVIVHNCKPCLSIDGYRFASLADARAAYAAGGYKDCDGGLRCRGTVVASWEEPPPPGTPEAYEEGLYGPLGRYLGPSSWRDAGLAGSAGEDQEPPPFGGESAAGAWREDLHPRDRHGRFGRKGGLSRQEPTGPRQDFQQTVTAVKQMTSSGRLDYNPNLRTHIDAIKSIAAVAGKIPQGARQQMKDRIDRISVESVISIPGWQTPLGSSVGGYYEPDSRILHISTDSGDVSHVIMHEGIHALDSNLQGGHRFSSRRDWMALCRSIWASDYAKTRARSYFIPARPADMTRAGRETFAELLACHFEGKPLSLTYSGQTPLPPDIDRKVKDFFTSLFGESGPVSGAAKPPAAASAPLCVGLKRDDGTTEFVSVTPGQPDKGPA